MSRRRLLITCEHAGHEIPENYKYIFKNAEDEIKSHRGWDPGAAIVASATGTNLGVPVYLHTTTRLLVEANRSLKSPHLFSQYGKTLDPSVKAFIIDKYYHPYRKAVVAAINKAIEHHFEVAHFSIHSFTPIWEGKKRTTDIGILYDPDRKPEAKIALQLQAKLQSLAPLLTIDLNEPYKGTDDGFTTYLRKQYPIKDYSGVEIEVNQRFYFSKELESINFLLQQAMRALM
ncbi:MAG: putative N-formylglutamate amidohydrolase [Roseivirga sp.]|jgi:predicted N-formylglutamate amidohydrolase